MTRRTPSATLVFLLLLACGQPAGASFFMRLRGSDQRQLQALGGQTLYTAPARVNGWATRIHVLAFDVPPQRLGDELRQLWSLPHSESEGPTWITRASGGKLTHALILPGTRFGDATVWLIEPTDKGAPLRGAPIPEPPGLNPCPAAELRFWIVNDQTHSLLTVSATQLAPAAALAEVSGVLVRDGWQELTRSASLTIFVRGGHSAVAYASHSGAAGGTQVAVFQQGAAAPP